MLRLICFARFKPQLGKVHLVSQTGKSHKHAMYMPRIYLEGLGECAGVTASGVTVYGI